LVLAVLEERTAANTICETLTAEAKALQLIVASRLRPEAAKPKIKTIQNMIRLPFHKANKSLKGAP
jgi:hypothetical protein